MDKKWLIVSFEHAAFWKPDKWGYTRDIGKAGRYSDEEADDILETANNTGINEVAVIDPDFFSDFQDDLKESARGRISEQLAEAAPELMQIVESLIGSVNLLNSDVVEATLPFEPEGLMSLRDGLMQIPESQFYEAKQ